MFETIVWATDGSELADRALDTVRELAGIHGSRIVALHINKLTRGRGGGASVLADEPDRRDKIARQVKELQEMGVDATAEILSGTDEVATLVARAAEELGADLIVVATHGRGVFASAVMGSVAQKLSHTAHRPVLTVPPQPTPKAATLDDTQRTAA